MRKTNRRPKGEGSITRLPNGSLKMTITVGVTTEGKQKRKSVSAKTKAELLKKVSEIRVMYGARPTTPPYFKEVVMTYLKEQEEYLTYNTIKTYETALKKVFEPLFDYRIDRITGAMLDNLLDNSRKSNGEKIAPSYLRSLRGRLSAIFNYAIKKELIDKSPMSVTRRRPKGVKKADLCVPTEEEMRGIISSSQGLLHPLCLLAVATGCRLGELLDLRMEDIDTKTNTIDINKQRTREGRDKPLKTLSSSRIIYVHPEVLHKVLEEAPCTDGYLFGLDTYMSVSMRVHKWLHQSPEIPEGFTFHTFRHYHATHLLKKGVDIKAVSKRLGHSSITTTLDIYAHWLPEVDRKAAMSIDDLI